MNKLCIVVTGLPASGKSTTGKKIANELSLDFLDKDDYLERQFEDLGIGDSLWRQKLSRDSDLQFINDAQGLESIVLVSHWKTGLSGDSGTPTAWLQERFSTVLELYCSCAIEVAASRFKKRIRHPGHLDNLRTESNITTWMTEYLEGLPLGIGPVVMVETNYGVVLTDLIEKIGAHFNIKA